MTSLPAVLLPAAINGDPAVQWRATQRNLWVARRGGRHLGTVECGRRYLATDVDGEPIGSFRSLEAAMRAVTVQGGGGRRVRMGTRSWGALAFVATLAAAAAAMLGAYGLLLV